MAGRGVNLKDESEVREYLENLVTEYRFGCYYEKNPKACHLLGDYMEAIKTDFTKAGKIYETNCNEYRHAHSCHKVGGYKFSGRGCDRDVDKAYAFFVKGCEYGYPTACHNAGLIDELDSRTEISGVIPSKPMTVRKSGKQDFRKALDFFEKACRGDIPDGCYRASSTFISGIKDIIPIDLAKAFTFAQKGCELGNKECCVNLSIMYKKGDGVEPNEKLSKRYANMARDMIQSESQERERTKYQEGAETIFEPSK